MKRLDEIRDGKIFGEAGKIKEGANIFGRAESPLEVVERIKGKRNFADLK